MLLAAPVRESRRTPLDERGNGLRGLDKLKAARSDVPAVTHVDHSARVQTVDAERHGRYAALLRAFEAKTGCPVLINTSFNVRGEPIVCAPEHAYRCFLATNMDALVLERFLLRRQVQPNAATVDAAAYLREFASACHMSPRPAAPARRRKSRSRSEPAAASEHTSCPSAFQCSSSGSQSNCVRCSR